MYRPVKRPAKPIEIKCDAILFDMDGTLVDSTECVERQWRLWAGRHGFELEPLLRIAHGRTTLETIRLIAPHLATDEEVRFFDVAEVEDTAGIQPVRGAAAFVAAVPEDRRALVTSAPRELARVRLECAGIPIPRIMVCSGDVSRGKPHPEPYLTATRILGQPAERCLAFEDTPPGVESARAAGAQVVGITTTVSCGELGVMCVRDFERVRIQSAGNGPEALSILFVP